MTQESWNIQLMTMIFQAMFEDKDDDFPKRWAGKFKRHWKLQPKEGESQIRDWKTFVKTIDGIDRRIKDHFSNELDDILERF